MGGINSTGMKLGSLGAYALRGGRAHYVTERPSKMDHDQSIGSTGHNDRRRCPYCGLFHAMKCHLVKAYDYHPDGALKRVEFFAPNDYGPLAVKS